MSPPVSPRFGPVEPERVPEGFGGGVVVVEPVLVRAPTALVWEILVDFESYPAWNPLNRWFDCAGGVGAAARFGVGWGPYDGVLRDATRTQHEVVTVWEPGRCLGYAEDLGRLHCAERLQLLTETPEGTRYQTWERWAGWITPLVGVVYAESIRAGFRAAGLALRDRAEAR